MKIAVATDDGLNIATHFGGSGRIHVYTLDEGSIVDKEEREKPGHEIFSAIETHPQTDEKGRHGFGPDTEQRHNDMFDVFKDCEALIVNMIGIGAYRHFSSRGVRVIATDIKDIDEALRLYAQAKLKHNAFMVD